MKEVRRLQDEYSQSHCSQSHCSQCHSSHRHSHQCVNSRLVDSQCNQPSQSQLHQAPPSQPVPDMQHAAQLQEQIGYLQLVLQQQSALLQEAARLLTCPKLVAARRAVQLPPSNVSRAMAQIITRQALTQLSKPLQPPACEQLQPSCEHKATCQQPTREQPKQQQPMRQPPTAIGLFIANVQHGCAGAAKLTIVTRMSS